MTRWAMLTVRPRGSRSGVPYVASCSMRYGASMEVSSRSSRRAACSSSSSISAKPPGKGQLSLERLASALDEEHLEGVAPDGQADDVHGHREDRVLARVHHEPTFRPHR